MAQADVDDDGSATQLTSKEKKELVVRMVLPSCPQHGRNEYPCMASLTTALSTSKTAPLNPGGGGVVPAGRVWVIGASGRAVVGA